MAFEVRSQQLNFQFGENCTFTFNDNIQQYVVGITGFALNYSANQGEEFWLLTANVTLDVVGVSGNTLTIFPNMTMLSGTGNFLAGGGYSWIIVTVLAWTGSVNNSNLILASNIQNQLLNLPSQPLLIQPVLSGFNLTFGMYPQNPTFINISTGVSQAGSSIQCYGVGSMYGSYYLPATSASNGSAGSPDTNYSVCNSGTVNTSLIINCDPGTNLSCVNYLNNADGTTYTLPATVQAAFMTGFFMNLYANSSPSAISAHTALSGSSVPVSAYILSSGASRAGFANFVTIDF